jgi:hypothetical protein
MGAYHWRRQVRIKGEGSAKWFVLEDTPGPTSSLESVDLPGELRIELDENLIEVPKGARPRQYALMYEDRQTPFMNTIDEVHDYNDTQPDEPIWVLEVEPDGQIVRHDWTISAEAGLEIGWKTSDRRREPPVPGTQEAQRRGGAEPEWPKGFLHEEDLPDEYMTPTGYVVQRAVPTGIKNNRPVGRGGVPHELRTRPEAHVPDEEVLDLVTLNERSRNPRGLDEPPLPGADA